MKKLFGIIGAGVLLLAASATSASALTLSLSGALTGTDPTFNRPVSTTGLSGTGTAVAYDTYTFVTDATGPYTILGDYTAGGVGTATGLDGYIFLYSSFNPASPLTGLLAADDDADPDGAGPGVTGDGSAIPASGAYGPATTTTVLTLSPATSYTIVVASFYNATNTVNGLGPYTLTVTGGAALLPVAVPEPSSLVAAVAGLAGLGALVARRRRSVGL